MQKKVTGNRKFKKYVSSTDFIDATENKFMLNIVLTYVLIFKLFYIKSLKHILNLILADIFLLYMIKTFPCKNISKNKLKIDRNPVVFRKDIKHVIFLTHEGHVQFDVNMYFKSNFSSDLSTAKSNLRTICLIKEYLLF